jgi:hypothetical protein
MAPVKDLDIRVALTDLTEDQPPVPPDRLSAIRRKATIRRRRRIAGGAVAALAAVAVAASLATLPRTAGQQPLSANRTVPSWALPWPDHRNGSVSQSVLDQAVAAWLYGLKGMVPPAGSPPQAVRLADAYPVVWYVGQTIDHGADVVVMFEADGPKGPQLVAGHAPENKVTGARPTWSPWTLTVAPAPSPRKPPQVVGLYASSEERFSTLRANWVVVLAAPDVRAVSWFVSTPAGIRRTTIRASAGLAVAYAGRLTSRVDLTGLSTSHGFLRLRDIPIGVPGAGFAAVPALALPPAPRLPAGWVSVYSGGGQGGGGQLWPYFVRVRARYALFAVCYGPQPLRIAVNGRAVGTIACNDDQHRLPVPASMLRRHGVKVASSTGMLTTFRLELGRSPER